MMAGSACSHFARRRERAARTASWSGRHRSRAKPYMSRADAGLISAVWRTERALEIFHDLGLERAATWFASRCLSQRSSLHLVDVVARHRRQQIPVIHSQIGASEPRNIRPELACSGSPLTSSGSSGMKNNATGGLREHCVPALMGLLAVRNSARNFSRIAAEPCIDVPQTSNRSSSVSRLLRADGVSRCR